jgi:UDP-N-acetylmuramyl tripeptide synthase
MAVFAGKVTAKAIRMLGAGLGSNLPGRMARKVAPAVLQQLSQQARLGVLAVTGTNGKSTTSGLLSSILRMAGFSLVHNRQGANLVTGITASLVDAATWNGKLDADYCLFEIDEAALPVIANEVKISTVLVTNLFRDQLDRFGELDTTAKLIASGIKKNQSQAVLNSDDPNVSQLAPESPRVFFGIESVTSVASGAAPASGTAGDTTTTGDTNTIDGTITANDRELSYCGSCGAAIEYTISYYGQLGHWRCCQCDYKRPEPKVVAQSVEVTATNSTFILSIEGRTIDVTVPLPGLFNVYNALAAAAAAHELGVSLEAIRQGLKHYKTLFGRGEKLTIDEKPVLIQLIKNPAGASQAVAAVVSDQNARILVAINDNLADGRDISWLWDADFEQLASQQKPIIVSGQRAEDMAVRMKYAGLPGNLIQTTPKLDKALDQALEMVQPGETLWILPTYTCLLELQKILRAKGHILSGT